LSIINKTKCTKCGKAFYCLLDKYYNCKAKWKCAECFCPKCLSYILKVTKHKIIRIPIDGFTTYKYLDAVILAI